ncbi:MAG: response regulator [bacterium]|nr:response regulator [bacterium]
MMKISTRLTVLLLTVIIVISIPSAYIVQELFVNNQLEHFDIIKNELLKENSPLIAKRLSVLEQENKENITTPWWTIFLIIVFSFSILIAAVLLFSRKSIFKPLESLIESFDRVGKGDLFHRIKDPPDDEIGKLSASFNNLTENLSNKVLEIRAINIKLDSSSRELEGRVTRRTKELSDTVEQLKQQIEERKRAEERLYVMDIAIKQSIDGVAIIDMDGTVRFSNEAWANMHGMPLDSFIKEHISVFHTGEQITGDVMPFIDQVRDKGSNEGEVGHKRANGETFPTRMSATLLKDEDDEPIGMMAIVRDITETKAVENQLLVARLEAESANRAKSQFLANMSHEIRTPMNAIIGMAELVADTELTAEQEDYNTTLSRSADALLNLLNDILDLSKIEVGKLDIEFIEFDFRKCVTDVSKNLAVQAQQKKVELICDVSWDIPSIIISDPGRLRQILTNLIGNSIKFTQKGIVVLKITVGERPNRPPGKKEEDNGKLWLNFSVSDTGIGIPADKQKVIFDKFTQTDSSITRKFGGTGLGLTISRQLVQLMNGDIRVQSPGELQNPEEGISGSSFYFNLPLKLPEGREPAVEPAHIKELEGVSALVVDDTPVNREIFEKMLTRWGINPQMADSGEKAIETLRQAAKENKNFDIVLMDVQMPMMNGFEAIEQIRKEDNIKHTPIVVMTSAGLKGDAKLCRELGVSAYLKKPVPSFQLLETLLIIRGSPVKPAKDNKLITRFSLNDRRQKFNILVAEDNLVNQKLIHRILEKKDFLVELANNGKETVAKLLEKKYDLVLMDIQMPEMDGIEATKLIRKHEKENGTPAIPIIALTAHAMKGDRERFLDAGMNGYVSKPIKQVMLMEAIEKHIFSGKNEPNLTQDI